MYEYSAYVIKVVDGDTFDLIVDIGFNITIKERFRLRGIDTPETWRPKTEGEKAHGQMVTSELKKLIEGKKVIVRTFKGDKYGRYLCDIITEGIDVAKFLIENDLVKRNSY